MTEPQPTARRARRYLRTAAEYRWTRARALAFLTALVAHGSVSGAARAVGVSRTSAYRLRARMGEPFALAWDKALVLAAKARQAR